MQQWIYIAAILIAIAGVAFFGGSEISFVSSDRFRIRAMAKRRVAGAPKAKWLLDRPATLLNVTLVGTNIFVVLTSSLTTTLLEHSLGLYAVPVSTVIVTVAILMFGEIIPKAVARTNPEVFLSRAASGLSIAYYLLYPVAKVTSSIAAGLSGLLRPAEREATVTRDEIRAAVKEAAQAGYAFPSQTYAHRVLDFSRMKVAGVMVPMDEVVCIDEESTVRDALAVASASGHSRYPVYKRTRDNMVGILHIKDLLGVPPGSRVRIFARRAYFVPETKTMNTAMVEMRDELRHLAIVTDEYGRPIGILTFEDLVEEIMGEIQDEYDRVAGPTLELDRVVSGSTPVAVVSEELDIGIPDGAYSTVAGFMLERAGNICTVGDAIEFDGFVFEVMETRGKRIRRVRITRREG
jgi:putative hemolysin